MKKFILVIFLIIGGLFLMQSVFALTVSPVKMEIFGDPGQTLKGEILLMNEAERTRTFYSSFENFEATGETGTPTFFPAKQGLGAWIEAPSQIILQPEEKKAVSFTIKIPQDADPGGHFAAIFWSSSPPQAKGGGQVSVSAKVGILVLLKVTGEIEEGVGLLEFGTKDNQKFFNTLPISFVFRFSNDGGDRIKPEGEITIKNIFGRETAVFPANKIKGNVLPNSIRKFETTWEKIDEDENKKVDAETDEKGFINGLIREKDNFAFGRYTAKLNLEYGSHGEKIQGKFSFFVIPWRILSLATLFLVVFFLLVKLSVKRHDKKIMAMAMKYADANANKLGVQPRKPRKPRKIKTIK